MKQIFTKKYRHFVLYLAIFICLFLSPLLYNYLPINEQVHTFYIGSSKIDDVVKTLEQEGYRVRWLDKIMLKSIQIPKVGWYTAKPHKDGRLFFFRYLHSRQSKTMNLIVYAGETAQELTSRLAKDMKLNRGKLDKYYSSHTQFKEADILAKRYIVARKADENSTMRYLFGQSSSIFEIFEKKYFLKIKNRDERKVLLTIASIIQKESNSIEEMPAIASVIYNRLHKGMKLQMDSTLNYGKYSHMIVTSERIKTDNTPFNTYKHKGLPPYPLGTVSEDALYAAIHPLKSDYLFFMLNGEGKHDFSATYEEHLENLKTFRAYKKEKKEKVKTEKSIKKKKKI